MRRCIVEGPERDRLIYYGRWKSGTLSAAEESLIPRLKAECGAPVVWVSDPSRINRSDFSPAIRVQTIHHAKGLQYRAVIFMWADQLPFAQSNDTEQDRKLFYVALTRATELLAIVHSGESTFVKETYTAIIRRGVIG
jgi:ATP-dependent exoDNAse (exonuclease V) beta subunit